MRNNLRSGARNIVLQVNGKNLKESEADEIVVSEFAINFPTTVTSELIIGKFTVESVCSLLSFTC